MKKVPLETTLIRTASSFPWVRARAVKALGLLRDPRAKACLVRCTLDRSRTVRRLAEQALAELAREPVAPKSQAPRTRIKVINRTLSLILSAMGILLEVGAFMIWTSPFFAVGLERWEGLLVHTIACLFLYLAWVGTWRSWPNDPKDLFQVILAFFFPGPGTVMACVMRLSPSITPEEAKILVDLVEGEPPIPVAVQAAHSIQLEREIQPISDILSTGHVELKREAIRRLSKRRDAKSVQLLKKAIADRQGEIRLYAVNALAQIEEALMKAFQKAENEALASPRELSSWMTLGAAHRDYAQSGLLEGMMRQIYMQKAFRAFEKARALFPEEASAWVEAIRTASVVGRTTEAETLEVEALKRFPQHPELRLIRAKNAFNTGRFKEVSAALRDLEPSEALAAGISADVLEVWRT